MALAISLSLSVSLSLSFSIDFCGGFGRCDKTTTHSSFVQCDRSLWKISIFDVNPLRFFFVGEGKRRISDE